MSFLRTVFRASKSAAFAIAVTFLAVSSVDAQVVINDSFANGISDLSGNGMELDFYTTSSSAALNPDRTAPGPLDFATGSSGRAIHGLFAPQTLSAVGESLEVTIAFTTPTTIDMAGAGNEDFRWALFHTGGSTVTGTGSGMPQSAFAMDIPASSNPLTGPGPNPLLTGLAGIVAEVDNINDPNTPDDMDPTILNGGTDLGIRHHNVNNVPGFGAPTGRLLTTTTGFDFIASGPDDEPFLVPNTDYIARLRIELNDPNAIGATVGSTGTLDVTVELQDAAGTPISTQNRAVFVADQAGGEVGVNTLTFDMLGVYATSDAFGFSNSVFDPTDPMSDPDNGIDISNVTITFSEAATGPSCDVNLDGFVNFADISPFIAALSSTTFVPAADCNGDGDVNFADIAPFIAALAAGP